MKRVLRTVSVFFTFIGIASFAFAQNASTYPVKPITLIVPFPPGGVTDLVARDLAKRLSEGLGQPVVVDNRAGAGGNIGTAALARAQPDGYTLGVMTVSAMSIGPHIHKSLSFVPAKDFTPIALLATAPVIIVVNSSDRIKTLSELIAEARLKPDTIAYGTAGIGSTHHLAGELLASMAKVDLLHIPYRGDAGSITSLLAGDVPFIIAPPTAVLTNIKGGKLKAIAATGPQRWSGMPEVPTVAEQGVPGYDVRSWAGLMAPAGTPKPIIDRLNAETLKAIQLPNVKSRLEEMGGDVRGSTSEEMRAMVASETQKWTHVVNNAKIPKQ